MGTIVHIGYHKTGSTWFQKRLYPAARGHRALPRRLVQEALLMPPAFAFDAAVARQALGADVADRPLILCEEELSGNPHSAGMRGAQTKDVAERIAATLPEADIVIFIRNQVDLAAALYRHYVREGGTYRPRRYLMPARYRTDVARHPFKFPVFDLCHLDYLGALEHYARLFGRGRVHVFPFETFRANPRGFVADFCDQLGLEVDLSALDYRPDNEGLGAHAMRLGRVLNRFSYRSVLDKHWWVRGISNKLRSNPPLWLMRAGLGGPRQSARTLLGSALSEEIATHFASANRELAARWSLPLAQLGYPL
jgi:hypothetical protein